MVIGVGRRLCRRAAPIRATFGGAALQPLRSYGAVTTRARGKAKAGLAGMGEEARGGGRRSPRERAGEGSRVTDSKRAQPRGRCPHTPAVVSARQRGDLGRGGHLIRDQVVNPGVDSNE